MKSTVDGFRDRQGTGPYAPDQRLQDKYETDSRYEAVDVRLPAQGPVDRPLDEHAGDGEPRNTYDEGQPVVDPPEDHDDVHQVGPYHVHLPMGEMRDVQYPEDESEAQGHQYVLAAQLDADDHLVEEKGQGLLPGQILLLIKPHSIKCGYPPPKTVLLPVPARSRESDIRKPPRGGFPLTDPVFSSRHYPCYFFHHSINSS